MGLFNKLFGSEEKSSATTNQTQTSSGTSSQTTSETRNQTQTGSRTTTNQTSSLGDESIDLINRLLSGLEEGLGAQGEGAAQLNRGLADVEGFIDQLRTRADGAGSEILAAAEAANEQARRDFETTGLSSVKQAQQGAGSVFNTFSQLIETQARGDLEAKLNANTTDAAGRARDVQNQELSVISNLLLAQPELITRTAGALDNQSLSNITQLLGVLKGAEVESTGQENTTQTLVDILDRLVEGEFEQKTEGTTTAEQKTKKNDGILKTLQGF